MPMRRLTPLFTAVLFLALTTAAWACPLCKDSIPSSDAQAPGGVPGGFNTTIYVMLGSLFAVIGMITTTLVRGARGSARGTARGFPIK
jgi:hypothetical protein